MRWLDDRQAELGQEERVLCAVRGRACDLGDIRQGQAAVEQGLAEPLHEARTLRRELVAEGALASVSPGC